MKEVLKETGIDKENALPIKYNRNYYVIQANELVRSRQDELSLLEAKLVRLAIAQVLRDDEDLKTYTCNVSRLADFLGISSQNIYRDVQELSLKLMKKSIFIRNKDGKAGKQNYKILHWVDYVEYKDGIITFKLSEHLKPYLVGLNELFTRYSYEEILKLPTNYSIRLYELLYSYANMSFIEGYSNASFGDIKLEKDEVCFTVEFLRDYFNCQEKYPNTGDFIKRVIGAGINEINKYTVYPCIYRTVRKHNKITHIIFTVGDWQTTAGEQVISRLLREHEEEKEL